MTRAARGYVLLPVAVAIALVGVIAWLAASESAIESRLGAGERDSARAEYVAQAGLQHALRDIARQGCGPFTNLSDVAFGADRYSATVASSLGSTTGYTLGVDADSWIRSDQPSSNRGNDASLHIRNEAAGIERALFRYDLSPIPAGAPILSATAWFYVGNAHAAGPIDIHLARADWNEADVTWDTMDGNMDGAVAASIPSQPNADLWLPVNLTAQVQAWVNGQPNYGIILDAPAGDVHAQYDSRESVNPPYLEVVAAALPSALAQLQAEGSLANGSSHAIRRELVLQQYPAAFGLQQLAAGSGEDAMLDSFYNARNFGDHELKVKEVGSSQTQQSLIRFELPPFPPGVQILTARLQLYHYATAGTPVDAGADVFRVTRDWVEGSKSGSGSADGATWDTWDSASAWTSAGGDYAPVAFASGAISGAVNDWESWEIGELVQGWVDGRFANHGLLLKGSGDVDASFYSKEGADASLHPRLAIEFSCSCGQVCMTPQGGGRVLMAVVNPTALVPDDAYKKALFESWGFEVAVISESANQITYDAAMADADVVFISETVNSNQLGNKLVGATIGVVSQDGDYNADLGIAAGAAWPIAAAIDITDSSHYITAPFTTGTTSVFQAPMEQLTISGSAAGGLQSLASSAGSSALAVLETGAALSGGGNAAGRRVMLPLGRTGLFNWQQLNGDGRLLLQRALTWGARLDRVAENLLLVVANPGSLTAGETSRKLLFESWGYVVNLIDESDTQVSFDAAIAANDVAYIAVDVDAASLGSKLAGAAIGVVNEEAELVDELGVAQGRVYNDLSQIDIVDNAHYITEAFATGLLTFVSATQPVHMLSGATAPGLRTLAQSQEAGTSWLPSLAVIEAGGELWSGGSTAGRRVQLPWGGETFNIDQLNDDGRTLLLRAIQWAGSVAGGAPPIAHWRLDETSGTTASDSIAAHDGNLVNGPSWTPALLQGGVDFDGSDDRIDIGPDPGLDDLFAAGATLSGWINARGWGEGGFGRIADKADATSPANGWQLALDGANGALVFQVGFSGGTASWSTPAASISLDSWQHVTLVYNSSSAANDPVIYIDGAAQPLSEGSAPSGSALSDAAADFTIGNHAQASSRTFDGRLDDIRLYDRMLSAAQVSELAAFPDPVAHWKFDDGSGVTAVDSAGNNDGSLSNGPAWVSAVLDGGIDFDGVDDHVAAGSFDVGGSGITMMGWFNAKAFAAGDGGIVSKASSTGASGAWWQLSTTDAGADRRLRMRVKASGTTTTLTDSSVSLVIDQWYFAAATYDAGTGTMTLYLDGVEVASQAHAAGGAVGADAAVAVSLGAITGTDDFFDGVLDDLRVYDYALPASAIFEIFDAVDVPGPTAYTELYQPWSASVDGSWETVDLSVYGVPADAVVEVAVVNAASGTELWGGVRALGSVLERRMQLHEAESGGLDALTMHVQADADSRIQHYAEDSANLSFVLLGYWSGVTYVELFDSFSLASASSWVVENLSDNGVGANQVAEIAMANINDGSEFLAGLRRSGSSVARLFDLNEPESGGDDLLTLMVETDAAASIEAFAESNFDVYFQVLGYWSTPPGNYFEAGAAPGQVGVAAVWQPTDLGSYGVPNGATAQFVLANNADATHAAVGLRATGSGLARLIDLQEAESGGSDLVSMHVNVDADTRVDWYAAAFIADFYFYPVGWWY